MTVSREFPSAVPDDFDLLDLHRASPERYPYLLQSAVSGPESRYDILFAFPGDSLTLDADWRLHGPGAAAGDFLSALDQWWRETPGTGDPAAAALPFTGGWFVFLGYELAREIEPKLKLAQSGHTPFVARAVRCPAAVVRDRLECRLWMVAEAGAEDCLAGIQADIGALCEYNPAPPAAATLIRQHEEPAERYLASVVRTLEYIHDGDVFQANLSRLWSAELSREDAPAAIYRRLRRHNPGPFNGLASFPGYAVISSSPERLVEVRGRRIATRPIAGTRPRGQGEHDRALSEELLGHPKERAEHIMLIDLERNDLGRVCRPGTVEVNELMKLESYAHVHHIVSNVRGELRDEITPGEVIRAVFPGGTITGCPKVRCMEIIAELEGQGRGAYTGSMGYLNLNGDMDLNILIRTIEQNKRNLFWRAGAGIVADSRPELELEETRAKARGLILALGDSAAV